jgi:uncharacterized membrane protein
MIRLQEGCSQNIMIQTMQMMELDKGKLKPIMVILPVIAFLILAGWWYLTPPGMLGKADAIGYAICHRIPERSFWLFGRQMPLCARCSGMQLGALIGMAYLFSRGRYGKMPPLKISLILAIFFIAFAIDGINSYLNLFTGETIIYPPNNILRLVTGTGLGIAIAAVTVPIFNQTMWNNWINEPSLPSFAVFSILLVLAAIIILGMLSDIPIILFPLALLSAGNVLFLLMIVYSILVVLLLKKENRYRSIKELWVILLAGFILALSQISVMDFLRYSFTGSWEGFTFI